MTRPRRHGSNGGVRLPGFTAEAALYQSGSDYRERPKARHFRSQPSPERLPLMDYSRWRLLFEAEQQRIRTALGDRVIAIAHVGSTSVPGLAGRAEIDILVGAATPDHIAECMRLLTGLGYVTSARAPSGSEQWGLMTRPGKIPFEVLIVGHLSRLWRRHLWLRDYLRRDPERARAYGRLKSKWAARYGSDTEKYKQAKRRFWASVEDATMPAS